MPISLDVSRGRCQQSNAARISHATDFAPRRVRSRPQVDVVAPAKVADADDPVDDPDEVADADDDAHDRAAAPDPGPARSEAGRDDRDPSSAPPGADADPGGTAAGRSGGAADAVTTPVGG